MHLLMTSSDKLKLSLYDPVAVTYKVVQKFYFALAQ